MRLVDRPGHFHIVAGTAPLLSRLGLIRDRTRLFVIAHKPIRAATVMERFLIATLLLAGPLAAAVPTPKSHFGHEIGADRTVLDWSRVVSYFQALEKNSPRIRVQE